jgi:alkanesulfonate monooxygenase SsuD/methylene tetrahydromethanopterin reductase-like flavin-dependent oxidoreductase (luciferase family)
MSYTESYYAQIDEMVLAERCGFDHYWLFEHHISPHSPMPSPNLMIAAAAHLTKRIRFGTAMNILPYRHPLWLAEEIAMLDVLTEGRIDFGIGRGIKPLEFRAFGLDQTESREMYLESYDLIRRIWADESFSFQGKYFNILKETALSPPLVQKPHPPVYTTAQSPESLRWAAEHDYPFGQIDATVDDSKRDQAIYRQIQIENGYKPVPRLYITRETYVASSSKGAAEVRDRVRKYLIDHWQVFGRYTQFSQEGQMPSSYDAFRKRAPQLYAMSYEEIIEQGLAFVGTPDVVAQNIIDQAGQLDLAMFVFHMRFGGMPFAMAADSIQLFSKEVMPQLRKHDLLRDAQEPHGDLATLNSN